LHDIACYPEAKSFCWYYNKDKDLTIESLRKIKADVDIDPSAGYYLMMNNVIKRWKN
jgi:hypothetical protein